mmetsp:Transcript_32966/g.83181  ORF Transcript_32966/g.83181 Transcript_32966/m.83181 type:complete len:198 (-) Transcript_32966:152-745(-)|eukprot:CAMPEP_0173427490 /NCGR_PEP_ID=MMETSP1357-20121228/6675_1 /TAXON_ID=77926 /ORGANISM="Hemiselmis rufescens, Strain PCC563" /LENGTH=197 /DNA_ID=CAMNT_0014391347 /DNA_START=51 /DNA_END=644 /DNA_ORIENTATION=+
MADNSAAVMQAIQGDLDTFYSLTNGNLEPIGLLFSELAGQPVPPNTLLELLDIGEEALKKAQENKTPPVATKTQLMDAVAKSVDPEDAVDTYKKAFTTHVNRLQNASKVMTEITPALTKLHESHKGDLAKIEAFFCELAPEPHKGKPMPPGMINALLRIPPSNTTCTVQEFLSCMERNMDPGDKAESFTEPIAKHTA